MKIQNNLEHKRAQKEIVEMYDLFDNGILTGMSIEQQDELCRNIDVLVMAIYKFEKSTGII